MVADVGTKPVWESGLPVWCSCRFLGFLACCLRLVACCWVCAPAGCKAQIGLGMRPLDGSDLFQGFRLVASGWLLVAGFVWRTHPATSRHLPPHPATEVKKNKKLSARRSSLPWIRKEKVTNQNPGVGRGAYPHGEPQADFPVLCYHSCTVSRIVRVLLISFLLFAAVPSFPQNTIPPQQETVVVTGVPEPVPLEEVDRAVTAFDLRQSPELYRSWADFLELDPSLDLQQRAPNGVLSDLSIRGATFDKTLVMVNGFRINDVQTGHFNLDIPLPLAFIQRIEVLRGAGSTLYGSDAVAGAVNFVAAPPALSEVRLGTAVGNFGTNEQDGSLSYASPRFSEQAGFSRDFSTGFMPDRDYRRLVLGSDTRFTSKLGVTSILLGLSDNPYGAQNFYGPYPSWERTKGWFAALQQPLGNKTEIDLGYRRHTDDFVLFRDQPDFYQNNHIDQNWQAAVRRNQPLWQNAKLFFGVEGYHDSIDSSNLGVHARNHGALYVDLDVRAWRRFSFSAGLREELYGNYRSDVSPTASAGVWLSPTLKLRASATHGFRLPSYTELYYFQPAVGNSPGIAGNPGLAAESAWNFEGGIDWHATSRLLTTATVFYRREHNDIDYVFNPANPFPCDLFQPGSSGNCYQALNFDQLNFTGAEAAIKIRLAGEQEVQLAYTGIHGSQAFTTLQTRYLASYPANNAVVAWQGRLPGKILGRTRLGVTQRHALDPYAVWDISAMRRFSYFAPYLQLANVTNTSYAEIQNPVPVLMPGRSVVAGVEFVLTAKAK